MKATCKVTVEVTVGDVVTKTRVWKAVDVMKTAPMRAWARRQYNSALADMSSCSIGKDKIVTTFYEAKSGPPNYNRFTGFLSGVNGRTYRQDGIFEPL